MSMFIQKAGKFELEKYKKPRDAKSLMKSYVPFTGSPQKHPHDADKLILVPDPYSTCTYYYEFNQDDVAYVEKLSNIADVDGNVIGVVRIWVKKMSVAVRSTPFLVANFDRMAQG